MDIGVKDGKLVIGTIEFSLPGYRIVDELGTGANAKIFLVYNKSLDRNEALKIWLPRKKKNHVNEKQFYSELRKNSLFTGNNSIATIYTGGCQMGIYFCIMEYCPGLTLKNFLKSNPPWIYRWGLARQISDTMKSLYEKGIFHGDLHSNNIIININDNENWLKILDLGTSIFSGEENSHRRDARLLYDLSFQLLPCVRELAFYNDRSISELPSPLLNQAFRAVINISDPILIDTFDIQYSSFPNKYLPPDYHRLNIWEIASMVKNTPLFSLRLVEKFLYDFGFNKFDFYKQLFAMLNPNSSIDDNRLIDITTQEYSKLSVKYKRL